MANKYIKIKDGNDTLYPQTEGKIILSTGEANGKVLTSDGNGNAIWTDGVSGVGYQEVYFIKPTLSDGVVANSNNATTIGAGETITLIYSAPTGFSLPSSVSVTGATGSWNATNGVLTLSNATSDVSFSIAGTQDVDYFYIEAVNDANILFQGGSASLEYCIAGESDWKAYTLNTKIALKVGKKCFFKGDNSTLYGTTFSADNGVNAGGNIMSLVDKTATTLVIPSERCFARLFLNATNLLKCPKLLATTLTNYCYQNMFNGCINLTYVPNLPAGSSLPTECYNQMFANCSSLIVSDVSTTGATKTWQIPKSPSYFSAVSTQTNMFVNCSGTRASDDLVTEVFGTNTYYVENEPIG